ncbi:MAG TPA: lipoate--protein ligase family protein, partial [Verrucomicrobiae bacterium]
VVQGPGCLNYTLVLHVDRPGLHSIPATNRTIMERNRAALQSLLPGKVAVQGHTDLTLDGLKFSGNAQRRKRDFVLFHGTFLLNFDLALIERLLPMPTHQPTYRQARPHLDFVCNAGLNADAVRAAIASAWGDCDAHPAPPFAEVARLVDEKYSRREWNLKL